LFLAVQLAVLLRLPIPVVLPWIVIAAVGLAMVVSYTILATYVAKHSLGRANATFNLVHLLVDFAVQALIGLVVDLSPDPGGARQSAACQTALAIIVVIGGGPHLPGSPYPLMGCSSTEAGRDRRGQRFSCRIQAGPRRATISPLARTGTGV
jgi:drug/metabolite transporter superfamily protein YnfA